MNSYETFIVLMTFSTAIIGAAQKLHIPYPIVLVIMGSFIGFIPGLSPLYFDPKLLFILVLPPILYYAAFNIAFKEFKKNWKDIFSLALGLVVATTLIVALIFHYLFPQYGWAMAFAFGAIISPPDAVATNAILKNFRLETNLLTILEGESLINDASALLLFKLALVALFSGAFSFAEMSIEFIKIVCGGIFIGFVAGELLQRFSKQVLDPVVGTVFSVVIPYITYLLADSMGFSGILAVVVTGIIGSRILLKNPAAQRRLLGFPFWGIFSILLNCFVFILIGTDLRRITADMTYEEMVLYTAYGFLFTFIIVVIRMLWIYSDCLLFYFNARHKAALKSTWHMNFREAFIAGWAGMRSIVSLAAALVLPSVPGRDAIIFITFVVIFLTLTIPGFTLPLLIKWLKIRQSSEIEVSPHIRAHLNRIAQEELKRLSEEYNLTKEEYFILKDYFKLRHRLLEMAFSFENAENIPNIEIARTKILQAQRQLLIQLWEEGQLDDKLLNHMERELDIEESRVPRAVIR